MNAAKNVAARVAMADRAIRDARKAYDAIPGYEEKRNEFLAELQEFSDKEIRAALASATVSGVRAVLEDELTRRACAA